LFHIIIRDVEKLQDTKQKQNERTWHEFSGDTASQYLEKSNKIQQAGVPNLNPAASNCTREAHELPVNYNPYPKFKTRV
jgi:hypothetical protein